MQQIYGLARKSLVSGQYSQRFVENDVDATVLRHLTDQDLKEIGVSLGHRRIMLARDRRIGQRSRGTACAAAYYASAAFGHRRSAAGVAAATEAAERRHLTVMFCDLEGSTAISAQLDAEEWRDLVGAYLDAASAAVVQMGGHVAKKLGDGLMSLFGYPVAQENDSERAVRAALAIQRALAELNRKNAGSGKPSLNARIGIETGPVVVDAAGEIFGDAPNVAARVQALAEPGAVLVTARVQRQVAGLFVAEERGNHTLKGVPDLVTLFRMVRASGGGGRRSGQRNLTPLVGRDDETAMLMRRWERARQGDGQLVLIVGEPGLGKSRLIEEFHTRLADTPHTWVEWSCSQLLQNTPLHPIAEWGRQRFGGADVPSAQRLAELESSLAQGQTRPGGKHPIAGAAPRYSAAAGTRTGLGARGIVAPAIGSADQLGDRRRKELRAAGAGVRGRALGRSDDAPDVLREVHRRARGAGASLLHCDDPAGVPPALGHALAPRHDFAGAARSRPWCRRWWRSCPRATRCRGMSWRMSHRAPAACRCLSRR